MCAFVFGRHTWSSSWGNNQRPMMWEQRHFSLQQQSTRGRRRWRISPCNRCWEESLGTSHHCCCHRINRWTGKLRKTTYFRAEAENLLPAAAAHGIRKYFRINGHVGECTSKDTLSFSSLEHQTECDFRKGYPEMYIVEAVIQWSPGLKLRSYLEGKTDLTLATLIQILRAHYA